MEMFSLTRDCPMKSPRRLGRTLASMRASSSVAWPETMRCGDLYIGGLVMPCSPELAAPLLSGPEDSGRALLRRAAHGAQQRLKGS